MGARRFLRSMGVTRDRLARYLSRVVGDGHDWTLHRRRRVDYVLPGLTSTKAAVNVSLVKRLLRAYRKSFAEHYYDAGMWGKFFHSQHANAHQAFMSGGDAEAACMLQDPGKYNLHHGFESMSPGAGAAMRANPKVGQATADECKMLLLSLAEALGLERVDNPEHYRVKPVFASGPDTECLLDKLDAALGTRIVFPNPFPDEFGLATSRGVASTRAIHALYQACRIREILKRAAGGAVLEIGGGTGRTAFYAHALGVQNYTIVDLPFTAISQGYFLGSVLGEHAVTLAGEEPLEHSIKLISPDAFHSSTTEFDLAINCDSLTEMPFDLQTRYGNALRERSTYFLSINHEQNDHTVMETLGYMPESRYPCWLRRGYSEELYRF